MLTIKLRNVGKKHERSFRVIVQEKREKLDGKFLEDLGWWNPHVDKFELKSDRISYWLGTGAKPTHTALQLIKKAKIDIKGRS